MQKIIIVGHGNFPSGILSAVSLLVGENENIIGLNLNGELTHEQFEEQLKSILDQNDYAIVLADLTGGAPHQISARLVLESGNKNQYVISGVNLALIVDIVMKSLFGEVSDDELQDTLLKSIDECKETTTLLSARMMG